MSLNRTSFKGYNRGLYKWSVEEAIFFDDVYFDSFCEWGNDQYDDWWYDDYWYDYVKYKERERDEDFYKAAFIEFELELMRY